MQVRENEILSIDEAARIIRELKKEGKTAGLCHGVFDFVHLGHLRHFREAKENCDILFVSLTPDRFVAKGPGRPVYNERERAEFVGAFSCVDHVLLNDGPNSIELLRRLAPSLYIKGPDYKIFSEDKTGMIEWEARAAAEAGGKIFFTGSKDHSSSALIKMIREGK